MKIFYRNLLFSFVAMLWANENFCQVSLIATGSSWKYLANGSNQGTAWRSTAFSDATWSTGNAQLGYGDGDEATVVSYGPSSTSKYITTYFRKTISVADASLYNSYTLNVKRDDGVVVYINGVERFRSNMPSGTIAYTTVASTAASDDGTAWQTATLPAASLVTGTNVIAVEIHQNAGTSSDISFDLELKANSTTDVTAPVVSTFSPADNATNVSTTANLIITFNEPVQKGTGNIVIKEGGVIKQTIAVTASNVVITGSSVTIDPANFANSAAVNVEIAVGAFKDLSNNNYAGITSSSTWNFSITAPPTATLTRGPYLQIGTPNSIIIRWRSSIATNSKISYGLSAASLSLSLSNASAVTEHEMQLSGLLPDTKYYYAVGSSTQTLQGDANNFFITAPVVGTEKKTRVWVNGDCGNNSTNQKNVRDQYLNYMGVNYTDVWLLLGDNAYEAGLDTEFQTKFFDIYKDKLLKQTVLWPAPGNHEYNSNSTRANDHAVPYYDMFTMPTNAPAGGIASNTESYYSYNYANAHFISLDSYGRDLNTYKLYDTLGPQVLWLKKDLAANTQKWTIVYWHHPPYTMGIKNSDTDPELYNIRQNLLKILERYKVDLVLCGHDHGYERSKLIQGHYGNEASFNPAINNVSSSSGKYDGSAASCPYVKNSSTSYNGTVYVVAGSAGQLSSTSQASYPHAAMYYSDNTAGGSLALEIEANRIDAKWVCADGSIRDKFTLVKDVNIKKSISIVTGSSANLTASWPGSYSWTGGAVTRSITVAPTTSATYIVKDAVNCLADTFNVTVTASRPLKISPDAITLSNNGLRIYPNPTTGEATIEYDVPAAGYVSLEVFDIAGKKVKTLLSQQKNSGVYIYSLNTRNGYLQPGIYAVKLYSVGKQVAQKFIVAGK